MTIGIPFEIGCSIWFIHPRTMKATQSVLKGLKIQVSDKGLVIKYHLDDQYKPSEQEFYVYNVFKTREDLINSL